MRRALAGLLLWACAVQAAAQTPPALNPTMVAFTKSADHDVMLDTYTPAVTDYALAIYVVGAEAPLVLYSMGKPTPNEGGLITHSFDTPGPLLGWPISVGATYQAKVVANGPYGSGWSDWSNQFTYNNQWKCTFALAPTTWTAPPGGGTLSLRITVSTSGCQWSLEGLSPWVTSSVASGTTTTTVLLTAAPNDSGVRRTLALPVGSMRPATLTVSQELLPPGAQPPAPPTNVILSRP